MSRRRHRRRLFFGLTTGVAFALTGWTLVSACSSSSSPSAPAVHGAVLGDEPTPQRPLEPAKNKEGEICSRQKAGFDDCVKGFSGLSDGVTATSCHRLCAKHSDCVAGAKCGAITTVPPYDGLSCKTCTPLSGQRQLQVQSHV